MDRVTVRSRKAPKGGRAGVKDEPVDTDDDDYDMGDLAPPPPTIRSPNPSDHEMDDVPRISPRKRDVSPEEKPTLDEERDRIKKDIQERKRKRDADMLEQQRKEQEELERVRKARERIREQMKVESRKEEQRMEKEKEEKFRLEQEKNLLKRLKDLEPHQVGVVVDSDDATPTTTATAADPNLVKQFDLFLAKKWRGKINFKKPRIPLMAPSGNENGVTKQFRQQILEKFILTYSIRFEYKKKAILYAFESEDRLYRRYADQKRMYWLASINTLKSMGEFEEVRKLDTDKQQTGVNLAKGDVSRLSSEAPPSIRVPASDATSSPQSSGTASSGSPSNRLAFKGSFTQRVSSPVAATRKKQPVKRAPVYCICGRDETYDANMIKCDAEDCEREWFHFKCVGLSRTPTGAWFCPKHEAENRESELEFM